MATNDETISALVIALRDCADDLEAEIINRYGSTSHHPAIRRKFERDMLPVRSARLLMQQTVASTPGEEVDGER